MISTASLFHKIEAILDRHPEILVATVFGSAIKNRMTPESDIDIAIAAEHALTFEQKQEIYLDFATSLPCEVDLIDLHQVDGPLLQQALCGNMIKKISSPLLASLFRKMWYNQADMMPYTRMILKKHAERLAYG
ncbi:MAG: nucleotidyltransferase domain-containing protein [SAR324 cluster bacterium]|nr:nucleotidyltransferase domain-containing protein [SAR324 cluster bacterium]